MYANLTKKTVIRIHDNPNEFYITDVGPSSYTTTQLIQNKSTRNLSEHSRDIMPNEIVEVIATNITIGGESVMTADTYVRAADGTEFTSLAASNPAVTQ